jgi:hypothetical protein
MRHALMRHQHIVDDVGQALEVAQHRLQQIIGVAGQRIGLLDIVDTVDQRMKPLGIVGRMGRQRDVNEGDQIEAERLAGEVGVIARYHLLFFQAHPPPRALRRREADEISQLLIGQAAVVLQGCQHLEVESVYRDHAQITHFMHKTCMILAKDRSFCMHFAAGRVETPYSQTRETSR